nr:choice-of-anchor J domain-containing protein [Raineya sp.]
MLHSYLNFYKRTSWLCALVFMLYGPNLKAQVLLNEGFESTTFPPTGWSKTTTGATGVDWVRTTTAGQPAGTSNCTGTASLGAARSPFTGTPGVGYLITSAIAIPTSATTTLTICERDIFNDGPWPSTFSVRVSTTTNAIASFTTTLFSRNDDLTNSYTSRSINLTAYAGQTIYLAFVHDNNDGTTWVIDNINVTAVAAAPEINLLGTDNSSIATGTTTTSTTNGTN